MKIKKLFAGILAAVMAFSLMTMPAFAEGEETAKTGTITVENATYGKEYKAYKVFDATFSGDAVSYTVDETHKSFVSTDLFNVSKAADKNGNYSVSKKDDTVTDDAIIAWLKDNYSKFDAEGVKGTFQDDNATVKFENLDFGYYYVTSTLGSAVAVDTAKPNATVKDKNASAPTNPEKKVVSVDGVAKDSVTSGDAHVGSVIGFKVTGNATNWTTSGEGNNVTTTRNLKYEFEDTPHNMTIDQTTVKVFVNGSDTALTSEYTAAVADGKLKVTINLTEGGLEAGKTLYDAKNANDAYIPIVVTYDATIDATAAGAPAKNEIGESKVEINTYAFQVAKTDGNDPLPGAQFELWSTKGEAGGTAAALTFIDNGDGTYTYSETGTVKTLDMTTNTTITVKGLDKAWAYTLKETKVPDGYNQAEDKPIAGSSLTKVEDGTDTSPTSTTLYKETVVNQKGAVLPSTGGMGTTMFYVIGAILMAGAGVVLVSKRRMAR